MTATLLTTLRQRLADLLGRTVRPLSWRATSGGCCHETGLIREESSPFRAFAKCNSEDRLTQFQVEALGLQELAAAQAIRVPLPLHEAMVLDGQAILLLEWVDFRSPRDPNACHRLLGEQLAGLHRHTQDTFGWTQDNVIGDTPQINTPESDWRTFFAEHRLKFQADLARSKELQLSGMETLLERIPQFFESYHPTPSLLHGDLWSGNVGFDEAEAPILFDPAVYHGDRETDIAFTEMFGSFGSAFYEAYQKAYPLDPGYSERRDLYNLYHILNHFNLFGGGYGQQAQASIHHLLKRAL